MIGKPRTFVRVVPAPLLAHPLLDVDSVLVGVNEMNMNMNREGTG